MATGGPLPFLLVGATEVANAARTLQYLKKGLGNTTNGHWEIGSQDVCAVMYRPFGVTQTFVSPVADPAPWYNPAEPGSLTFLGAVLLDIQGYDSTMYRTVQRKIQGLGGAAYSAQHRMERTWKFRAAMVSADDAGAEYGLRWLRHVLAATDCDQCDPTNITVRLVCPPANGSNDTLGEWVSYGVVLMEGPMEKEPWAKKSVMEDTDVLAGCRDYVIVEWTMVATNPYLYKPVSAESSSPLLIGKTPMGCGVIYGAPGGFYPGAVEPGSDDYEAALGTSGTAICDPVTIPLQGTIAPVYTFVSSSGMGQVFMEAHASCNNPNDTPLLQMMLQSIPANSTVVVNCATRTVTVTQGGVTFDGGYLLGIPPGLSSIQWIEARDCDTGIGCFCARTANACSGGIDTTVQIATQYRDG